MDIKELLPRGKHDFERVDLLKKVERDALRPIIPELLKWLQDTNWPISAEVGKMLLPFDSDLIPYIQDIFQTDDDMWKYWILSELVSKLSKKAKSGLTDDLNRFAYHPTAWEQEEGVDEIAIAIIASLTNLDPAEQ